MPAIAFGWENYCSPTGNDSTGDGSIGNPYLTLGKCLTELAGQSQTVSHPYSYFILRTWMRAGTYAESVISASQPFPGDPTSSIATGFESVQIVAYPGELVTLQPASGTNVVNLTDNNSGALQGASCFVQFQNIIFDAVNVSGVAFDVGSTAHHNVFFGCNVINGSSHGFRFNAGTHDNQFKQAEVSNNAGTGIVDAGTDNTIEDNLSHNNGDGISLSGVGICQRNRAYANTDGIICSVAALVRNNMAYVNTSDGITASAGKIYNNSCYGNTAKGINASGAADPQNDICFGNGTNAIGSGSTNLDSGADPLFVDSAAANFHLLAGSPAINAGATLVLVPFDADIRGRPAGAAYDIGAYEFIPPGTVAAITNLSTHFALADGRSCSSPMNYRICQATPKAFTGTPKVGIALCVDPASTPSNFTGYVFSVEPSGSTGIFRYMRYDHQPLTGLGTVLFSDTPLSFTILGAVMSLVAGTNTLNATNSLWANIYESTNTILGGVDGSPLPRTNLGFGVVGIGATVSIVVNGDDLEITTEDGTFTFTLLQGTCMNSLTNIAAFDETFTFHVPVSYNKTTGLYNGWSNYGIQSAMNVDIKSHCQGEDCYGAFWNACYNYLEINPQGGDRPGDGLELEFQYNGIVSGTPRTGVNLFLFSGFTNVLGTLYGIVVDEIDQTIKLVRWINQSLAGYGTVMTSVSFAGVGTTFRMLIWLLNDGSIRADGDPAEWFVWLDPTKTSTYGAAIIDDFLDITPYGQIVESPNELMKWKNTQAGLTGIGTQSGNTADVANWNAFGSMDQLL